MNILAIECSHPCASLCLTKQGQRCSEHQWRAERNHDLYLFPALQDALEQLGEEQLHCILIGAGPGSYGGIRVAIAAATGIQLIKNCQLAALDSWAQLQNESDEQEYIISDAKRGGWTLRQANGHIQVHSTEELLSMQSQGARFSSLENAEKLQSLGLQAHKCELIPSAQGLISSWQRMTASQQEQLRKTEPSPIYVRPPHITQAKRKPWEC